MSTTDTLKRGYSLSTPKNNDAIYAENHRAILDFIYKRWDAGANIPEIMEKVQLKSRQTIYDHLRKACEKGEVIKEKKRYYDKRFIETRQKAEEAYDEIISFSRDDLIAVTRGRRRYVIGDNPNAIHWLSSTERVAKDLAKKRGDAHRDKKLAQREGWVFADEFSNGLNITIACNKGEFLLRDKSKITEISGPLPFPPKIVKAWNAEIYDNAIWMAYKLYEQLENEQKPFSRESELVIKVRLNPYQVISGLFERRYLDKMLCPTRHELPVFPEFEKRPEYQVREKHLKEQFERERQWHIEHPDPVQYMLDQIKRSEDVEN